jgi:endonuclease/exonuclease/phosphatase family metal-dependent hydrolase
VPLLVRTWNLFHGRTKPPSGRTYLERMIRLIVEGDPDVVALQEVPVWALRRLPAWSGMETAAGVARPGRLGGLGRRLTQLAPDVFRSLFNGQANALLFGRDVRAVEAPRTVEIKPRDVLERRVCQLVRVSVGERTLLLANLHATAHVPELARAELGRVAEHVAGHEPAIVCGDFNVRATGLPGFSEPNRGIDQIIVRGLEFEREPAPWPAERRRYEGHLLSDHPPVEAVIA